MTDNKNIKLYFAPMEGICGYIFRNAFVKYYGGADKYFTPFVTGPKLGYKEINDILPDNNLAAPLVPQILANNAEYFLAAANEIADYGYDEVNLNLGCPSGTVVSKKRGAGFLSVPDELDRFLDEIFNSAKVKISIKTRIGIDDLSEWDGLLKIFKKYPFYELIIHPRLRKELYGGTAHREAFIQAHNFINKSKTLVYNGDICTTDDFESVLKELPFTTHFMIGRGMLRNPEIFSQIRNNISFSVNTCTDIREKYSPAEMINENHHHEHAEGTQDSHATLQNNSFPKKTDDKTAPLRSDAERLKVFLAFHNEICENYEKIMFGEKPVLFKMKELWNWWAEYCALDHKELKMIRKAGSLREYRSVVKQVIK